MIADDIARDIWRKESSAYMNQEEKPKLTVYMSIDIKRSAIICPPVS